MIERRTHLDWIAHAVLIAGVAVVALPIYVAFVGSTAYVVNFDVPRRDNLDANGVTAKDGIGASIARVAQ